MIQSTTVRNLRGLDATNFAYALLDAMNHWRRHNRLPRRSEVATTPSDLIRMFAEAGYDESDFQRQMLHEHGVTYTTHRGYAELGDIESVYPGIVDVVYERFREDRERTIRTRSAILDAFGRIGLGFAMALLVLKGIGWAFGHSIALPDWAVIFAVAGTIVFAVTVTARRIGHRQGPPEGVAIAGHATSVLQYGGGIMMLLEQFEFAFVGSAVPELTALAAVPGLIMLIGREARGQAPR